MWSYHFIKKLWNCYVSNIIIIIMWDTSDYMQFFTVLKLQQNSQLLRWYIVINV